MSTDTDTGQGAADTGPGLITRPAGPVATQLLSPDEVGARLGIHRQSVYRLIWAGHLAAINVGTGSRTRLRVKESVVEAYLAANTIPARVA